MTWSPTGLIRSVKQQLAQPSSVKSDQHQFSLNNICNTSSREKLWESIMLETMSMLHEGVTAYLKIEGALPTEHIFVIVLL